MELHSPLNLLPLHKASKASSFQKSERPKQSSVSQASVQFNFVLLTVNDSDSHKTFSVKVICSFLETDCPLTEMSNPAAATPTRCQASARENQQQLNIQNSKYKYQHQHVWVWMRF